MRRILAEYGGGGAPASYTPRLPSDGAGSVGCRIGAVSQAFTTALISSLSSKYMLNDPAVGVLTSGTVVDMR